MLYLGEFLRPSSLVSFAPPLTHWWVGGVVGGGWWVVWWVVEGGWGGGFCKCVVRLVITHGDAFAPALHLIRPSPLATLTACRSPLTARASPLARRSPLAARRSSPLVAHRSPSPLTARRSYFHHSPARSLLAAPHSWIWSGRAAAASYYYHS